MYGAPSDRVYYRLRLPSGMANEYADEHGEQQYIWAESPNTLCIGPIAHGSRIRILDVREMRKAVYRHFRQITFPVELAKNMQGGEEADVTRDGDIIRLEFGRKLFADMVTGTQ